MKKTIKEDVIHKIKSAPISIFESDNLKPFPEELNDGFGTSHTISTLVADLVSQTDEMIFTQIEEIIKQSGIQTLYVLNRHQIIEALQQYVETNRSRTML